MLTRRPAGASGAPTYSDRCQAYDDPNVCVVIVPLATVEQGLSRLSLVGQVTDDGVHPPEFHLDIIEVL